MEIPRELTENMRKLIEEAFDSQDAAVYQKKLREVILLVDSA